MTGLSGSTKRWSIKSMRNIKKSRHIIFKMRPRVSHTGLSTPRNVTVNKTNCDWLFDMTVKRPHGRALTNKGCHLFQTFSRQSEGLATQDYCCCISSSFFFSCETMDLDQCCRLVVNLSNTKKIKMLMRAAHCYKYQVVYILWNLHHVHCTLILVCT